jgi:hypothetical protein
VIVAKEPWRLGHGISPKEAVVAAGKEAFVKLREAAGVYGELLDLLKANKWIVVKLAADDAFRAAFKQKTRERSIDVLREVHRRRNSEISTEQFSQAGRQGRNAVIVASVVMYLRLIGNRGGSLHAKRSIRRVRKALAIAGQLEEMGLRPNIVRAGFYYDVYIATADLVRLAERYETVRRALALYLAEKAKNGTPRLREIARKLLQRYPFFSIFPIVLPFRRFGEADIATRKVSRNLSDVIVAGQPLLDITLHMVFSHRTRSRQRLEPFPTPLGYFISTSTRR